MASLFDLQILVPSGRRTNVHSCIERKAAQAPSAHKYTSRTTALGRKAPLTCTQCCIDVAPQDMHNVGHTMLRNGRVALLIAQISTFTHAVAHKTSTRARKLARRAAAVSVVVVASHLCARRRSSTTTGTSCERMRLATLVN